MFLQPPVLAHFTLLNAWLPWLSQSRTILADSYAQALINVIMDTAGETHGRVERLDVLYRNFLNEVSQQARPAIFRKAVMTSQIGLFLGIVASCLCVVLPVPGESVAEATGRMTVGIVSIVYYSGYFLALLHGVVSLSRRWQHICRVHLSNPRLTQRALELGPWRTVSDFTTWLRINHDLRQQLCGIAVDHESVGRIASVLGSGAAIVTSYGVTNLVGLR